MLFKSFGFSGLNEFIIQDDKKIIKTLLYDFKKTNKSDVKVIIISEQEESTYSKMLI